MFILQQSEIHAISLTVCVLQISFSSSEKGNESTVYLLYKMNESPTNESLILATEKFIEFARNNCSATVSQTPSTEPSKSDRTPQDELEGLLESELRNENESSLVTDRPEGYYVGTNANSKYVFRFEPQRWRYAKAECDKMNYELFYPTSVEEMEYYAGQLKHPNGT